MINKRIKLIVAMLLLAWAVIAITLPFKAHGAVINVPAGVFPFNGSFFKSGNEYIGAGVGKTIFRNPSTAAFAYSAQLKGLKDVTIRGMSFDLNGIEINNACERIVLEDIEITNARRTRDNHQAIFLAGWSKQITIRRLVIRNCSQALQIYGCEDVRVEDFVFESSGYGLKWGTNGAQNGVIRNGVIRWMHATMGLEIQNDDAEQKTLLVEDIAYIEPELYADDSKNGNAMAFSIPTYRMGNIVARRLYANGLAWVIDADGKRTQERRASRKATSTTPRWAGLRVGGEVGGTRPSWSDSWFINLNDPIAITSSTAAQVFNNRIEHCLEAADFASPANGADARPGSRLENNGPAVALPAYGGWSLVGVSSGSSIPIPPPPTLLASPVAGSSFAPGEVVTIHATGRGLRAEGDLTDDGKAELSVTNGATSISTTITIPITATERNTLRVRLFGDGGNVEAFFPVVMPPATPSEELALLQAELKRLREVIEQIITTGQGALRTR